MSDEEIEYLGSAAAKTAMQPPVTGIVLTVEPSDNGGAHRLVFNRSDGSVVPIGRRPGGEVPSAVDLHSAMFRCAVVSRKHAKIMFSDNTGHAYIIDLNSHHGTHLRKPGQLSSRMLLPELPTILSDGDIITLGKTVGRNEECVRPVVFRVELVRNPATAVASPEAPRPWLAEAAPTPTSDKASSGRFGIYVSSGSSDEMDDSEVEEVFDDDRTKAEVSVITTGATKVLDVVRNIKLPPPLGPWMNLPSLKEVLQAKSRSHSPMELESPPLPPSSGIPFQDDIPALDQIIFAGEPVPEVPGVPTAEPESQQVEESSRESSQGLEESPNASDPSQLVEKLKDDISKLHAHRRKYRAKFNANVHTISVKMADYDKRITELAEKHEALDKKVADVPVPDTTALETQMNDMQEKLGFVLDVDLPDLQAQVDNIDGELCDLTEQHDEMNAAMDKTTEVTQKVQEEIQKLEGFLEELNQLRQKAREQIDQTMHEIQQTSEDAMKKIALDSARMVEALAQQPTAQPTLKRKRDADDEGDDLDAHNHVEDQPLCDISPSQPESITTNGTAATIEDGTSFVGATTPSCVSISRPRKRLRRVASVFAQTATAVTVGAIVTWSALAFT